MKHRMCLGLLAITSCTTPEPSEELAARIDSLKVQVSTISIAQDELRDEMQGEIESVRELCTVNINRLKKSIEQKPVTKKKVKK